MAAAADEMGAAPAPHVAPAVPPSPRRFLAAAWAASLLVPVCRARPCMWALHTVVVDLGLGYRPCAYTPSTLLLLVCVVIPAVRHDTPLLNAETSPSRLVVCACFCVCVGAGVEGRGVPVPSVRYVSLLSDVLREKSLLQARFRVVLVVRPLLVQVARLYQ